MAAEVLQEMKSFPTRLDASGSGNSALGRTSLPRGHATSLCVHEPVTKSSEDGCCSRLPITEYGLCGTAAVLRGAV